MSGWLVGLNVYDAIGSGRMVAVYLLGIASRVHVIGGDLAVRVAAREDRTEQQDAGLVGDCDRARLPSVGWEIRGDLHNLAPLRTVDRLSGSSDFARGT